jgi:hypothetical protein
MVAGVEDRGLAFCNRSIRADRGGAPGRRLRVEGTDALLTLAVVADTGVFEGLCTKLIGI